MDVRAKAAKYYDLDRGVPQDIPFYLSLLSGPNAHILELGCGTGRVLLSLASQCGYIHGIDRSEAMLSICRRKLAEQAIPGAKIQVQLGDITTFSLGRRFDWIIAPYRVFQALESDSEVDGFFRCIKEHLAENGYCVLNTFNPRLDPEGLHHEWSSNKESLLWTISCHDGTLEYWERRAAGLDAEKLVLYPKLIYRLKEGEVVKEEVVLPIAMRCWYPEQFVKAITDRGFRIVNRWGGYAGEHYGNGPELVLQFCNFGSV